MKETSSLHPGLIKAPSHAQGGTDIIIKETGTVKEVEGDEYMICQEAYFSDQVHEFNNETDLQILDSIHKQYACPEFNANVNAADFFICKKVINDNTKRHRSGTVKEILNEMQAEKRCVVTMATGGPAEEGCGCKHDKLATGGPAAGNETGLTDQQIIEEYPKLSKGEMLANYEKVLDIITHDRPLVGSAIKTLEQYEGRGGQTQLGIVDESIVHQFYTPYIVCKKMWDLAYHYGFTGGNVCEPSVGTGRFFKFAPKGAKLFGFDLEPTNIKIASKLYPEAKFYEQAFETAFLQEPNFNRAVKKSWLPEMDLIIGNPPYGDYAGYYKTYMPSQYKRFEFLFIRLGLQLLKPGGLLIYIISQNLMNNGAMYNKMKEGILEIGTFVDAIRLPGGIFTSTQIGTDIVIFKKK